MLYQCNAELGHCELICRSQRNVQNKSTARTVKRPNYCFHELEIMKITEVEDLLDCYRCCEILNTRIKYVWTRFVYVSVYN